jgi:hypothetical protein
MHAVPEDGTLGESVAIKEVAMMANDGAFGKSIKKCPHFIPRRHGRELLWKLSLIKEHSLQLPPHS